MLKFNTLTNKYIFFIILILATVIRFYNFSEFSLSNDELSALNRLKYNNFSDLIEYGVKTNDFHPAGIQVFLFYWTKLFGISEFSVRIPFVIAGILSVLIIFIIAKKWFNETTALFTSAALALLLYSILYSQIARPYSFGLLFCLCTTWFWTKLLFNEKHKITNMLLYSLFTALAAYTHHYAALTVLLIGITGLFFLNKTNRKYYLISGIIACILYIPHIPIFAYQMNIGGVGGEGEWLGKPDKNWLDLYLKYAFNNSIFTIFIILSLFLINSYINRNRIHLSKYYFISIFLFVSCFSIGYYYSIYRNPILQYSILLFSFPFLLMILFSTIDIANRKLNFIYLLILCITISYTTFISNDYYSKNHFGEFKNIAKKIIEWECKYTDTNITKTININHPYYIDYYFDKYNYKTKFEQYYNNGGDLYLELCKIVDNSNKRYFIYAETQYSPPEVTDIIIKKYPYIIEHINYNGLSDIKLLSLNKEDEKIKQEQPFFEIKNNFNSTDLWSYDNKMVISDNKINNLYLKFDSLHEWGPAYRYVINDKIKKIKVSVDALKKYDEASGALVISITSNDGKNKVWLGQDFKYFLITDKWGTVFLDYIVDDKICKGDVVLINIWNGKKCEFYIDNFNIYIYK